MPHTTRNLLARLVLALAIVTLILGCSCTKPRLGTLSGTIQLVNDSGDPANDPADLSGVCIALYAPAVLDTAIVRANNNYPGVGLAISQETEFDHREHSPLYSASSVADGSFIMAEIEPGRYNIVLSKEGWGWRYLLDCQVEEGDNTLSEFVSGKNAQATALYPERIINQFDQISTLQSCHFYLVNSNVTMNHDLILESGTHLLLAPQASLTVIGNLNTSDAGSNDYIHISSHAESFDLDDWFGKILVQGNANISNAVFSYSLNGIQFQEGSLSLADVRIRNGSSGLVCRNNNEIEISNVIVSNIGELVTSGANIYTTDGGIDLTGCQTGLVDKVVAVSSNSGIRVRENCGIELSNCYFANNTIGLEVSNNFSLFNHSHFEGNYSYDARAYGTCSPVFTYNNFNSDRGLNIGLSTGPAWLNCTPAVSYNNFRCKYGQQGPWLWAFAIRLLGNNMLDIEAGNNYFYTTNVSMIESLILDQNDYDPDDWSNYVGVNTGYVDYIPFLFSRVNDAGINI